MKKSLLLLGVAVAAITSCTNDEVLEMNPQTTISFDGHVNKSTRAVTETTSDLSTFYVFGEKGADENYGTSVFNNVEATDDAATSQVWTRSMYSFGAYATKNASGKIPTNIAFDAKNGMLTFTNYKVDDTEDLVAAVVKVNNTNGDKQQTVDLQFKHLLSQVMFEIVNGIDNYSMKVTNITLKNVATKGTCEFNGAASWEPANDVNNKVFAQYWDGSSYKAINGLSLAKDESVKTEAFFVIPNQEFTPALPADPIVADITVEFWDGAVQVSTNQFKNVSVVLPSDAEWTAGYKYVYSARVADANTEYITFNVKTVESWENGTTDKVTLN